jgi:membrane protease YdiL (CAAX protease family)
LAVTLRAVLLGMVVAMAGTIPRNIIFAANLQFLVRMPWAVPVTSVYLWLFWRYLAGAGPPLTTARARRSLLRANRLSSAVWVWALLAGSLGVVALVLGLRTANRLVSLPAQQLPNFANIPRLTVVSLLLFAAPVAGVIEEAAFRGYMQGPIERRYGVAVAILVTGVMFAVAHLDFTLILLPYYIAVAAIYGAVTHLTDSILPAVVLHTGGNLFSNLDLWLHGQAEWQTPSTGGLLVWSSGADAAFWLSVIALLMAIAAMLWAFWYLAQNTHHLRGLDGQRGEMAF